MSKLWAFYKKSKLFYVILLSGIAVTAASMAMIALISSYNLRNTLSNEIIQWKLANLKTVQNGVEVLFEQINTSCLNLLMSDATANYENNFYESMMYSDADNSVQSDMRESIYLKNMGNLVKLMTNFVQANKNVHSVYFYDVERDTIITSAGLNYPVRNFGDTGWMEHSIGSQVYPVRLGTRLMNQHNSGYPINVVTIVVKTFVRGNYFAVNIDAGKLMESSVSRIIPEESGNAYFISRTDGKIMLSNRPEYHLADFDMIDKVKTLMKQGRNNFIDKGEIVFFTYSPALDNYFITTSSTNILKGGAGQFNSVFYPLVGAVFTIIAVVYFLITRRIYRPILRLVRQVNDDKTTETTRTSSELDYIGKAYSDIKTDRSALAERMEDLKPLVKSALLNGIIFDQHSSPEEVEEKIRAYVLDIPIHHIYVAVFDIRLKKDLEYTHDKYFAHFKTIEVIKSVILPHVRGFYTVTDNYLTLIVGGEEGKPGNQNLFLQLVGEAVRSLSHAGRIVCTVGISKNYGHIFDAGTAFAEAVEAVKYKVVYGEGEVISAEDIKLSDKLSFRYPSEMEAQLLEYIILGNTEQAGFLVEKMIERITDPDNNISIMQVRQYLFVLFGNIIKQLNNLGVEISEIFSDDNYFYESLLYDNGREEIAVTFRSLIDKIGARVSVENSRKNSDNVEKIIDYMEKGYHQNNISLESAAEYVGLNGSYVSRLIKKECGSTFTEYLTAIRMRHAKEMLKNGELKVEEIAMETGYNNTNYFIRTFKTHLGCTPGEYRKQYRKGSVWTSDI